MKKIKAIKRLLSIRKIRKEYEKKVQAEIKLIDEGLAYMDKWDDIPMSELIDGICQIMNIQRSKAAREMFTKLYMIRRDFKEKERYAKLLVEARAKYVIRYVSDREQRLIETVQDLKDVRRFKEAEELQKHLEKEYPQ